MPEIPTSTRRRRLQVARVGGVAALGVVAQIAVDVPEGYLGAADVMTRFGALYAVALVATAALTAVALLRRWRAAGWLGPVLFTANVGVFVPAFIADPVVAGSVVVWNLTLLAQSLFPPLQPPPRGRPGSEASLWLARNGTALNHLALASLLLTVGVVGYRLSGHPLAQGVALAVNYGTLAFAVPLLLRLRQAGNRAVWLVAPPVLGSLVAFERPGLMLSLLAVSQAVLLGVLIARQQSTAELLRSFYDRPSRLIVGSFATLVLVGTVLLTFPAASAGPEPVSPLDALFTATSATCVTGLIVLDTPHDFSTLGHVILLVLIQVGGLGIMVLGTFATLLLGGSLGLRGERALTELLDLETGPTAYRLTRFIVLVTLGVEAVGAAGLTLFFRRTGLEWGEAAWHGVFHAVSAFCNAGFALQSDSLILFRDNPGAQLLFAALILVGGLGFAVLAALGGRWTGARRRREAGRRRRRRSGGWAGEGAWRRLWQRFRGGFGGWAAGRPGEGARRLDGGADDPPRRPFSTQVRVVLAATVLLALAGTVLFGLLEWEGSLAGLPLVDRVANALFQSVTLRTAGFNTVDFARLAPVTVLVMMAFMFVGASPGSTGGGIKTTTLAVLLAAIRSTARSEEPVHLFDREVPQDVVYRSLAILVISAGIVLAGLFLLLVFESQPFLDLAFEVVSAFGTVGLSLGATAKLGPMGKLIIIGVMFIGRIGPLTLALLLGTGGGRSATFRYPPTRLMVG